MENIETEIDWQVEFDASRDYHSRWLVVVDGKIVEAFSTGRQANEYIHAMRLAP